MIEILSGNALLFSKLRPRVVAGANTDEAPNMGRGGHEKKKGAREDAERHARGYGVDERERKPGSQ